MSVGLLLTSFGLGLRHGVDWDHIAAIADLTSAVEDRRRGFILSMLYALGHAAVVFALGGLAIGFGAAIPDSADEWMGRVVGFTLVALGVWILFELIRHGRDFRLRSRWMLILDGTFAGLRRVRQGWAGRRITVEHDHPHEHAEGGHDSAAAHDHSHLLVDDEMLVGAGQPTTRLLGAGRVERRHSHRHSHDLRLPESASGRYGHGTATGIGMLHGIGVESPTQIAVFVASTSVAGVAFGFTLLAAWIAGLVVANAALALLAGVGVFSAERSFAVYATVAVVIGLSSVALGSLYLFGLDVLPALN